MNVANSSAFSRLSPSVRAGILALGAAVALGFGRFAYALILPDMRADLNWSYSQAGWMNGVNAAGYLAGALVAARLGARIGHRGLFTVAVLVTALSILATGLTRDFEFLTLFRLLTGLTGAFVFVIGGAMTAQLSSGGGPRAALVAGLFYTGPGFGMAVTGVFIPTYSAAYGPAGWQGAWLLLGLCAIVAGAVSLIGLPAKTIAKARNRRQADTFPILSALPALFAYMAFGGGYIGYMTFIFALLRQVGASPVELSAFWILTGLSGMVSPWVWARLIGGLPHGRGLSALIGITCLGAAIPLVLPTMAAAYVSGIIFGSAFLAVVAATTAFVRRNAEPEQWTSGIAAFTIVFGFGQTVGPLLVGLMSDRAGSLSTGLWYGCLFLVVGMGFAASQSDIATGNRSG